MNSNLDKLASPVSRILRSADEGVFFRSLFKSLLVAFAGIVPLSMLSVSYKALTAENHAVAIICSDYDEAREIAAGTKEGMLTKLECSSYEENKKTAADTNEWRAIREHAQREVKECEDAREKGRKDAAKSVADCEKARNDARKPWLTALGIALAGLGVAQVFFYRASAIASRVARRYPVTPIVGEVMRAFGEAAAVVVCSVGVFGGIQLLLFKDGTSSVGGPFSFVDNLGASAIVVAPFGAAFILLLTHFTVELMIAVVAIADNTSTAPKQD